MGGGARADTAHEGGSDGRGNVKALEGAHVVTVDASGSEFGGGHVVVTGNRVTAVGPGAAPATLAGARRGRARRGGVPGEQDPAGQSGGTLMTRRTAPPPGCQETPT